MKNFFKDNKESSSKGSKFTEKVKLGFSKIFKKTKHVSQQRQEILYNEQDQIDEEGINHGVGRLSGVDDIKLEEQISTQEESGSV